MVGSGNGQYSFPVDSSILTGSSTLLHNRGPKGEDFKPDCGQPAWRPLSSLSSLPLPLSLRSAQSVGMPHPFLPCIPVFVPSFHSCARPMLGTRNPDKGRSQAGEGDTWDTCINRQQHNTIGKLEQVK